MNYDFPKIIQLDEFTKNSEPTIQIVRPRDLSVPHVKLADEALDYIKHVRPMPGKTVILVLAMTAGEYYGPNRNGDAWPEHPLVVGGTKITEDEVLPKHYKSFETSAKVYRHHINKDPAGSIGDILRAFYNWLMHRVELLLALDNNKAEEVVQEIESGKFPAVSMGCFAAGTLVTMADGTRKPIEDVKIGDLVLTHKGNAKRVRQTHKRPYQGPLYHIKPAIYPEITCTEEHPFWAANRETAQKKTDKGYHRWDPDATLVCDWTHAKCLEEDHLLFEPIIQEELTPDYVSRAFARLFGYYLAEGYVSFGEDNRPLRVTLTVNRTDPVLDEINALCAEFGTRNKPHISTRPNSEEALNIDISDAELATLCLEHGGRYGRHKRLSHSAMRWHPKMQREMLGAYANGDGCGTATGALQLSTASPDLAWQLVSVLHRIGITPSIQNVQHKAGTGFNDKNTHEWVVFIGKQWAQKLRDVCAKVKPVEILAHRNDRHIFGNQIATPIRSITSTVGETLVYNLEVEDDESYVAGGMSVHNCKIKYDVCSICGNAAPNRSAYCDHAKWQLSQFMPNGKQVFVWNPAPKFFDLSIVRRPADRIGFMMKKVAEVPEIRSSAELGEYAARLSRKLADASKLSIINKVINGDVAATKEDNGELNVVQQFANYVAKPIATAMLSLDDEVIRELVRHRPAEVLSTLASMGIYLTTPEFIKFFVWKIAPELHIPEQYLRKAVEVQQTVFDILAHNPTLAEEIEQTDFLDIAQGNINADLQRRLAPLLEKRSCLRPYIEKRLVDLTFSKAAHNTDTTLEIVDPETGVSYKAARAVESAPRWNRKSRNIVGGAALLAGAYKLSELTTGTQTKTATLRLAQDWSLCPKPEHTTPQVVLHKLASASFEKISSWLGEVICL